MWWGACGDSPGGYVWLQPRAARVCGLFAAHLERRACCLSLFRRLRVRRGAVLPQLFVVPRALRLALRAQLGAILVQLRLLRLYRRLRVGRRLLELRCLGEPRLVCCLLGP